MPTIQTLDIDIAYGKFILEPLEKGYGQTIGNALRRVLLSSIQGAAITAIRVDKVFHEFAAVPGLKEDTTELILNLKNVAIKMDLESPPAEDLVLKVDVKGPGRVTGADIICPPGVEIKNPEVYIATISEPGASLTMDLYVGWDSGYRLPEKQEKYKGMIGIIPTGSQFTPVRKVNYIVEQTRVGMRTDYERLMLEVWTNGALPPNDAVTQSAQILDRYFRLFFDLGKGGFDALVEGEEEIASSYDHVPEIKIEDLEFSQRTFNCLRRASLLNLRQLAMVTESDLTSIRGFGKKSLNEVRDKLAEHGLSVRPPKAGYGSIDLLDDEDDLD